jgi:hypothetical protein
MNPTNNLRHSSSTYTLEYVIEVYFFRSGGIYKIFLRFYMVIYRLLIFYCLVTLLGTFYLCIIFAFRNKGGGGKKK